MSGISPCCNFRVPPGLSAYEVNRLARRVNFSCNGTGPYDLYRSMTPYARPQTYTFYYRGQDSDPCYQTCGPSYVNFSDCC